ncbi:hypothetical protein JOB18_031635 [Solea senegalensis]|uniref:Uncharacterized protein n=1 Tax=Solea senegalensis TaxID=28829 RepID=A0AAV6RK94_SOLSE|nr:hypothetical protein JOB18_031635 [Solea senegalensis]
MLFKAPGNVVNITFEGNCKLYTVVLFTCSHLVQMNLYVQQMFVPMLQTTRASDHLTVQKGVQTGQAQLFMLTLLNLLSHHKAVTDAPQWRIRGNKWHHMKKKSLNILVAASPGCSCQRLMASRSISSSLCSRSTSCCFSAAFQMNGPKWKWKSAVLQPPAFRNTFLAKNRDTCQSMTRQSATEGPQAMGSCLQMYRRRLKVCESVLRVWLSFSLSGCSFGRSETRQVQRGTDEGNSGVRADAGELIVVDRSSKQSLGAAESGGVSLWVKGRSFTKATLVDNQLSALKAQQCHLGC